jgi:SAM-dependent methyltransferase
LYGIRRVNQSDPKQGEREYFARVGPEEIKRAFGKPFTDRKCEWDLGNITAIFHLLGAPPAKIAELGCGVGWLSIMLARRGFDVLGVDISPDAIAAGSAQRDALGLTRLEFQVADYENLAAEPDSFDAAVFFSSLHHAEDDVAAMRTAHRILKPGGILIAFEPGEGHGSTDSSRRAVDEFGVHEQDMPIARIVALGEKTGFSRHLKLPEPWDFLRTVYRPSYRLAKSSGEARQKFRLGVFRAFRRFFFQREDQSFVVLWK